MPQLIVRVTTSKGISIPMNKSLLSRVETALTEHQDEPLEAVLIQALERDGLLKEPVKVSDSRSQSEKLLTNSDTGRLVCSFRVRKNIDVLFYERPIRVLYSRDGNLIQCSTAWTGAGAKNSNITLDAAKSFLFRK